MSNLSNYFRDTVAEMKQVTWPTQKQAMLYTVLVIGISVFVALFLGLFDHLFGLGVDELITRF
jgi:preprotein translocase subunit SecE